MHLRSTLAAGALLVAPALLAQAPSAASAPSAARPDAARSDRLSLATYLDWEDVQDPQLSPTVGRSCSRAAGWTS